MPFIIFKVFNLYGTLLFPHTKILVFTTQIALFTGLLFASIAVIPKIDVGLDQELALPKVPEIKKNLSQTKYIKFSKPRYMCCISHLGCQYGFSYTVTILIALVQV